MVIFLFSPRKFANRTWFCNCPQYICLFHIVIEYIASIHDQGKMLVLPNRLLSWVISTSDQGSVSFQSILFHPHTLIRIILFLGVRISILHLEFSPSHVSIGFAQIAFSIIVLLKDDRTDSVQEERLGHDFGHLCRGRQIQMSGHSDFGIFNNLWASSIFTWEKADTASAACPSQPGNLEMISMILAAVIWDAEDPCSVNTAYDPESSFNSTFVFLVLCLQFTIFQMTYVH